MLKLYRHSAASLLVLMVPISTGAPLLPYCTPSSTSSLSTSLSNGSAGWMLIALMDERTRSRVSRARARRGLGAPLRPRRAVQSSPDFDTSFPLWLVARLRLTETRKFSDENRGMLQRCRLSWGMFLFSPFLKNPLALKGMGFMLHNGLLLQHIFKKPPDILFGNDTEQTDCPFKKEISDIL